MLKIAIVLLAAAVGVTAADVTAHKTRMDDAQDAALDLKDALDAKDAPKTAETARRLGILLEAETGYWAATGLQDVRRLSQENRNAARAVADQAGAGDWVSADAAYARLQASCRTCHDQHPERRVTPRA